VKSSSLLLRSMVMAVAAVVPSLHASAQIQSIVDSPHNLSATGPGDVRAATEQEVCIFCHTPHNASPIQPLWNRNLPVSAYTIYSSNALDARPGQPTGASKMCLSCHDGTIALGSVVSRDEIIQMALGITTLPPGSSNLGTDLSDDHPISFRFDSSLVAKDPHLVPPSQLPDSVRLDANQELQCTSCHEPHNNVYGSFMVMPNNDAALCRSCHTISHTSVRTHEDCRSCHQTHTAPSGPYLLRQNRISNTCTTCHDGSVSGAANILADLLKLSVHDTGSPVDPPDPIPGHATCADCHDPHTMDPGSAIPPAVHPNMGRVAGVDLSGAQIAPAHFEYEVCFKCHADDNAIAQSWVPRRIPQTNTRLEFAISAVSFHPVAGPGKNMDVPSLRPGLTTASIMHCSDCHGSDTSIKAGGSGPNGVHGSNQAPLLLARYATTDFTPESASAYALCYQCHERDTGDGILRDRSFPFHSMHVVDARTPCSACHDAHGISSLQGSARNNSHLINFDSTIVFPDSVTGRLEFVDDGRFAGRCFLSCHGVEHSPKGY